MKIYYEAYGCTLSKAEAGLYVNKMLGEGNTIVHSPAEADISVINTCVVIKSTEDRMIDRISDLASQSKVRVLGCLSSVGGNAIEGGSIEVIKPREFRNFYAGDLDDIEIREPSIFEGIPINQGCTGSCNFCISHIARGKLVSRPPGKIVSQVRMQLEKGIREVRISSLDTAAYGKDLSIRLPGLVNSITSVESDFRLRIGMMEPKNTLEILPELMDSMQSSKVFKFLHLPVQSGDNRILDSMNREYSAEDFLRIVGEYRSRFPDSVLSTDIITGYHGDDEESFELTCSLLDRVKPEICNITRYSPRPYTVDYSSPPPPSNMVKRWTREITELHRKITSEKLQGQVGKYMNILVTERGKQGTWVGRDDAYRPVVVPGEFTLYSRLDVEIVATGPTYLIGKVS